MLIYPIKIRLEFYLSNISLVKVIICYFFVLMISMLGIKFLCKKKAGVLFLLLFSASITSILSMTVLGRKFHQTSSSLATMFETYRVLFIERYKYAWYEILLNILLFVPFGLIAKMAFSKRIVCLMGLFISLFIEIIQLITGTGVFEISDLIHNTLGAIIGCSIYVLVQVPFRKYHNSDSESISAMEVQENEKNFDNIGM